MTQLRATMHAADLHTLHVISGVWGKRLNDLMVNWAELVDHEFLLDCFRHRPGSQRFIGEHFGKYLDGVLKANQWVQNEHIQKKIQYLFEQFVLTQEEDGYIGTYLEETKWKGRPHHLIPEENGWDPWVFKYNIIALLGYYDQTGWAPALETSKKAVDLLIRIFGPEGAFNLNKSDEHWGLASGSVLEAVMLLYRRTEEQRYMDFAKHIVTSYWASDNGMEPRILPVLRAHGDLKHVGMGKAYEMISCFVGLLEYCRCTGEQEYLDLLVDTRNRMARTLKQVNGNMSDHEWFREDGNNSEMADMENCVAFSWMQFNLRLFEVTGDVACLDDTEETAWNHILSALCPDCSTWQYYLTLTGPKRYAYWSQAASLEEIKGAPLTCCHTNGMRAMVLYPQYMYTVDQVGKLSVNLYAAARSSVRLPGVGNVRLEQITDFPQSGVIKLHVKPETEASFSLRIRVPQWAETAEIEGQIYRSEETRWVELEVSGETLLHIRFDMSLRLVLPGFINRGKYAVGYGPFIFAVDECPAGWSMDQIGLLLRSDDLLQRLEVREENGWPCMELPALQMPAGLLDRAPAGFPYGMPKATVKLRPLMFAGLGGNLAYSQSLDAEEGLTYDRQESLPEYRVLVPCYFCNDHETEKV